MGLAWQQGPLATRSVGQFLVADPLPERLLFAEPLRRRMRVRFGGQWVVESEDVVLLHEPDRYPVAFFPLDHVRGDVLVPETRTTRHRDLGPTAWFSVRVGDKHAQRAAWQYTDLPSYATMLQDRVAFAWRSMDAFYEEDERIVGHAADLYHRNDIRQTSRHLVVRDGNRVIAETRRPIVLYESGFAPRWYVPRDDVAESALTRRSRDRRSARTRAWPATTTSGRTSVPPGPTSRHGPRWPACRGSCRSSKTSWTFTSTAGS